ncbi:hypothetical protein OSB04_011287 [Centaurea solstitialis]|uniref:Uncharacterized protein n=1 Tax=Centaurea solstitialis TaxID=347529 RepID=A0AA38TTW4_9ASTR|nr:hypothetical protein OSB04_011287 [Centaurea solstitialis]
MLEFLFIAVTFSMKNTRKQASDFRLFQTMHFQMKIQPIDDNQTYEESIHFESPATATKPVLKSRLKRLFDRQFPSVLKSNSEKTAGAGEVKDGEFEPSSVCLAKMVQNFIEDAAVPEKPKCGGIVAIVSTETSTTSPTTNSISRFSPILLTLASGMEILPKLSSLTPCSNVIQRNLLADTSNIVEKNKNCKPKDELRKLVAEELLLIGYDASICKSRWEKSSSIRRYVKTRSQFRLNPSILLQFKLIIVLSMEGFDRYRLQIGVRDSSADRKYKAILQSLPYIFVGEADRLQQILSIISEAAKLSLKKKGMHIPPWRKLEYMRSKWLSAYVRSPVAPLTPLPPTPPPTPNATAGDGRSTAEMVFGEETTPSQAPEKSQVSDDGFETPAEAVEEVVVMWQPPAIKPRNVERGGKLVVTGLASLFKEKVNLIMIRILTKDYQCFELGNDQDNSDYIHINLQNTLRAS